MLTNMLIIILIMLIIMLILLTNTVHYAAYYAYCYRFASPADPFQMFRDSMEVRWILGRVGQSVDASKTSGD